MRNRGIATGAWSAGLLLTSVLLCSPLPSAAPSSPVDENEFANGKGSTSFPFEVSEGVILVPVSIHGSPPLRFVLDSGSTRTLIDRTVAASLGLKEGAASSLQGAGQGRIPIHALHGVDLQMPGLASKGYDCFTIDLKPVGKTVGIQEDGILGYDFFARFALTVDFESKQLTLALPAAFHRPSNFEELPLEIRGKWAYVKGELLFPGPVTIEDSFFIDSGSSDAVDHPIVKTLQSKRGTQTGVGLGTPVEGARRSADPHRCSPIPNR
jgi:hypothetical protein